MPVIFLQLVLVALIGYLWGSIPAGYWMGKLVRGKDFDIRDYGSHKIGATNVLRTLGKWPAAIVFLFDLSKGLLPTFLALMIPFFFVGGWGPALAGLAALLGRRPHGTHQRKQDQPRNSPDQSSRLRHEFFPRTFRTTF